MNTRTNTKEKTSAKSRNTRKVTRRKPLTEIKLVKRPPVDAALKTKAKGKIIFLDIDGVLNCMPDNHRQVWPDFKGGHDERAFGFNPELVSNLKTLIDRTDAKIVVSSSWRHFEDYFPFDTKKKWRDVLASMLGKKTDELFIGSTGALSFYEYLYRGGEIKKWMDDHKNEFGNPYVDYNFCIIDDEVNSILKVFNARYVVHTDRKRGLTPEDADVAYHILNFTD